MSCIYINNYRGFSDTLIPVLPVNFFVGENSTGKTSVLALLELLTNQDFQLKFDFNCGNYEFGGYDDIVSVFSRDKSEFQIGYCVEKPKHTDEYLYYLFHFRKGKNGLPNLIRFSHLHPTAQYFLSFYKTAQQVCAIVKADIKLSPTLNNPKQYFNYLLNDVARTTKGYTVLKDNAMKFIQDTSLVFGMYVADMVFNSNSTKSKPINFERSVLNIRDVRGLAPIRTKPKRTYDGYTKPFNPEGEHTPYIIRKHLTRTQKNDRLFSKALNVFGENSGLFQSVGVNRFGKDSASPFEVNISLNSKKLRINSVGYGVSQALPVAVELISGTSGGWIAIQQPEVHLHPKAQAALGDMIFQVAKQRKGGLFIETHSDYLIDRFRMNLKEYNNADQFAQVMYFERDSDGNHIHPMIIEPSGHYPTNQPKGFRDFFLKEQMRILGV